ncbi:MAG: septum formation initiator family protein [Chloroflexia bacterium]|nr:septum formation initiator family protein [Chloroflexia bacterium]
MTPHSRAHSTKKPGMRQSWRIPSLFGSRRISPATIIVLLLGIFFLFSFVNQVIRQAQLEQFREEVRADVARLKSENATLQQSVEYAESNDYAEQIAREQLGYAREGDTVLMTTFPDQIVSSTVTTAITPTLALNPPTPTVVPTEPNWMRWWRMLRFNP